jgi:TPR repeat protein
MPAAKMKDSYDRAMAHPSREWLHVMYLIGNRAVMKGRSIISSLALVCSCMWTLDLFAAASSSPDSRAGAAPCGIASVSRNSVSISPTDLISEFDQRDLSALNLLGIRYAKGQGVKRNPRIAMRFFLRSALKGYTPAMANVGTLYETGATGRPNQHRAYAWVRAALSFGVPEEDHDATVLKLGMIAARLGPSHIGAAERLAGAIATRVAETCQCSPGQETELASNGSR